MPAVLLLCAVLLGRQFFVAHGLRMPDSPVWSFTVVGQPEVKDDAVGLGGGLGNFLGFLGRTVQNLHPASGNLDRVVVVELIPGLQRDIGPRDVLGNEVFHLFEQGIRFRGFIDQAFEHVTRYGFAVVMVGAHHFAIHLVGSQDMNIVAVGRGTRLVLWRSASRPENEYSGNQKRGKECVLVIQSFAHSFSS